MISPLLGSLLAFSLAPAIAQPNPQAQFQEGGAHFRIELPGKNYKVSDSIFTESVRDAARAVSTYFKSFPAKEITLELSVNKNPARIFASIYGGKKIVMRLGKQISEEKLRHDWTLTHEMMHAGLPDLDPQFKWIEEGMATYLEPVARAGVGQLTPQIIWRDLLEYLPSGLPSAAASGLDHCPPHNYRRIYWGGALFWLLLDIGIAEKSNGQKSLRDLMITFLRQSGGNSRHWNLAHLLDTAKQELGSDLMRDLYLRFGPNAGSEDLPALWKKLGVKQVGDEIQFDDQAPWARIRKSLYLRLDGLAAKAQ